ncbi:MAG TPA: aldo/keto reductase [Stackebrandtia sp.]|jgi:aryl-alcohol dehydrogenase-like predicted oxidoreductase|uniref:aldo/keto reductase n=1 Tax=Stackebrandtia sp. TaxID=2023065 RepID=UPI002D2B4916|nr:aldo/keto reductase [Stackebrandtia sp.]HZE40293.1 aldo/keto reductase [Stackebrandtia sp.]
MRYQPLGTSGLIVSAVGLGCNNFGVRLDYEATRQVVDTAIDNGITLFDTADMYSKGTSEELLGRSLKGRRDQAVIATKFGHAHADMGYGPAAGAKGGRAYIRRAVEASLRRLDTDYIDLYQLHTPDPYTPIDETLAALDELVREGKVRYIGHSNLNGWEIARAAHVANELGTTSFVSAQNHWSMLERYAEVEVIPASVEYGLGVLPYFPLAMGLLTGKVRRGVEPAAGTRLADREGYVTEAKLDKVEALIAWADKNGLSILDVAIGGLLALPGCASVIAGATKPEQVTANVAAGEWDPTDAQLDEIDEIVPALLPTGNPASLYR